MKPGLQFGWNINGGRLCVSVELANIATLLPATCSFLHKFEYIKWSFYLGIQLLILAKGCTSSSLIMHSGRIPGKIKIGV